MISLVLVSDDKKKIANYLKKIIEKGNLFFEIQPEKKEYSIAEIKNLHRETSIFNKSKRIYLLKNFHQSSIEAQNSFLKLLEEPPKNVLFILTTNNENKLLPTIISRVKIIYLKDNKELVLDSDVRNFLDKFISQKNIDLSLGEKITLDEIILYFREKLGKDKNALKILKEALKLKNLLENNNLNPQLTVDHMLIFIKKQINS